MSSYIVDSGTINQVLVFLLKNASSQSDWVSRALLDEGLSYNLKTLDGLKSLGEDMFLLNVKGVEACYGKRSEEVFEGLSYDFDIGYHTADKFQSLKSLDFFLYQCSEGDIPETSVLYKALREVSNRLAKDIVRDLPQWESAKWG